MQRFKDKLKEIEKQEELIQRKKVMLDQKQLGQKLIEQQKAMTSPEAQSSKSQKNPGTCEPANRNHSVSDHVNAFSNDGSFLKAFQLLQQQKKGPEDSGSNDKSGRLSSADSSPHLYDAETSSSPLPPAQQPVQHPAPPPPPDPFYFQQPHFPPPPQQQPPPYFRPHPNHQFMPGTAPPNVWPPPVQQMPPFPQPYGNFSPAHTFQRFPPPYGNISGLPLLPPPPPPPPPPPLPETSRQKEDDFEPYDPLRPTEDSDGEEAKQEPQSYSTSPPGEQFSQALKRARKSRWAGREESPRSRSRSSSPTPKVSSASSPRHVAEMIAKSLSAGTPVMPQQKLSDPDLAKQLKEQQQLKAMEEYIRARQNAQRAALAMQGGYFAPAKKQGKYGYDSDEEIDDEGTWEHKARRAEMDATKEWACSLDEMANGKHHIGDFLPPDEMKKFTETFEALKEGRTPRTSDYEKFKLTCENVGFQMLTKLGWKEGEGLGSSSQGIVEPVGRGIGFLGDGSSAPAPPPPVPADHFGATGAIASAPNDYQLSADDDEFDTYRKRMMLAYRFRPNPMNNPRRPYY